MSLYIHTVRDRSGAPGAHVHQKICGSVGVAMARRHRDAENRHPDSGGRPSTSDSPQGYHWKGGNQAGFAQMIGDDADHPTSSPGSKTVTTRQVPCLPKPSKTARRTHATRREVAQNEPERSHFHPELACRHPPAVQKPGILLPTPLPELNF